MQYRRSYASFLHRTCTECGRSGWPCAPLRRYGVPGQLDAMAIVRGTERPSSARTARRCRVWLACWYKDRAGVISIRREQRVKLAAIADGLPHMHSSPLSRFRAATTLKKAVEFLRISRPRLARLSDYGEA